MAENPVQRRLAAILAADVVGYSRLMGQDEAGTLAAVRKLRAEVIEPKIADHQGRLFKSMGDGFLVEFPSVVNAVACAAAIQKAVAARNADLPEDRAIQLRIGVHVGDVISEGGDVYGEGVNVAARLEGIAPPGGIAVSAMARENIGNRLQVEFEDVGDQQLKNITRPVKVYRINLATTLKPLALLASSNRQNKPSIAVLPFVNMSNDPSQEYFADGLTEDIITAVSHSSTLLVISRTSVFAYKGKTSDIKRIAQELSVDYIMEGSVRRSGDTVRVTAQLIEATSGHHVWANKYDGSAANIFEIQDNITKAIAACTNTQVFLTAWQSRRLALDANNTANELALASIGRSYESTPEAYIEGLKLADDAIALDPTCHMAYVARAVALLGRLSTGQVDYTENSALALDWAKEAARLAPGNEYSHFAMAWALANAGQMEEAVLECERGLEVNPNSTLLLGDFASFCAWLGRDRDAIAAAELALRLSPRDPANHWRHSALACASFVSGDYERCRAEAKKLALSVRRFPRSVLFWAASAAALDDHEDARMAVARCLAEYPDLSLRNVWPKYMPRYVHKRDQETLEAMLRKAGLPE